MACCIVFSRLLLGVYRLLGLPRQLTSSDGTDQRISRAIPLRPLLAAAAVELLAVAALVWALSRFVSSIGTSSTPQQPHHVDMPDMAGSGAMIPEVPAAMYWTAAALIALASIGAAAGLVTSRARGRAALLLLGGAVAAAALSPPTVGGAQTSHVMFMIQIEAVAAVAPILIILAIRPGWLHTAAADALSALAPYAAGAFIAVILAVHIPRVHSATMHSAVGQAIALLAIAGAGAFVWITALGDVSDDTARRRTFALLASQEAMGILGLALLVSPIALYTNHLSGTSGLNPLVDQRLAGAVMVAVDLAIVLPVIFGFVWTARDAIPEPNLIRRTRLGTI